MTALAECAHLHRALKQYDKALVCLNRMIVLKPGATSLYVDRSRILVALKKPELALPDAEKAFQLHPFHAERKALGDAYFGVGKYQKAVDEYTDGIAEKPNDTSLFRRRAAAYEKLGKVALAESDRRKLSQSDLQMFEDAPFQHGK